MHAHHALFWQELKMQASDAELLAIAAAYALIAISDGSVVADEVRRLRALCPGDDKGTRVRAEFVRLVNAMRGDFERGKKDALARLRAVPDDAIARGRVLQAAQIAVVADGAVIETEEIVLRELAEVLGVADESPE